MSYALEYLAREELPTGKLYIEDSLSVQYHRQIEESSRGRQPYALYNLVMMEFEDAIRISDARRLQSLQGRKRLSTLTYLDIPQLAERLQQKQPRFIEMGGKQVPVPSNPDAWHAVNEIVRDVVKEVTGK